VFGPAGNTIPAPQRRGAVFLACHNAIWEHSANLLGKGINPDSLSHQGIAAELTNHPVEGVVLTPGISGAIPKLQEPASITRPDRNKHSDSGRSDFMSSLHLADCRTYLVLAASRGGVTPFRLGFAGQGPAPRYGNGIRDSRR
jgi:hypothetical protein